MSKENFITVLNNNDLAVGKAKVISIEGKQIAVFRLGENNYHAIDNRCPHEGYPLVQGTITDCTLTCDWHNWKFNLNDGQCLRGGEDVRSYNTKIVDEKLQIDIGDPPVLEQQEIYFQSLTSAMAENDDSRAARDIVRLLKLGFDGKKIIAAIACYGAAYDGEGNDFHGWEHGMAVMVDCARMLDYYQGVEKVVPLVQALSAVAETRLRQKKRDVPESVDFSKYESLTAAKANFLNLVETEQVAAAEAVFRAFLEQNPSKEQIKAWLFPTVTSHFLSYGHRLIYLVKAFQLLDIISWDYAKEILPVLIPTIIWATREDRLPYMRKFQSRLNKVNFEALFALQQDANANFNEEEFCKTLLDGSLDETFNVVDQALNKGVSMMKVAQAIVLAGAERCLRFNISIDQNRNMEEGWLDVTHCFTHASAVREALEIYPSPELLRGLFLAARFVQYTRKPNHDVLDLPANEREKEADLSQKLDYKNLSKYTERDLLELLVSQIDKRQPSLALETTRAYLDLGHSDSKLLEELIKYTLADSAEIPIMLAHTIKTTFAAIVEYQELKDHKLKVLPLLAAIRFLAAPKRQRWAYYNALQAIDFVAKGQAKE
jgi:nitrite reductase/ring-hydroxylating ferredoxin subunit